MVKPARRMVEIQTDSLFIPQPQNSDYFSDEFFPFFQKKKNSFTHLINILNIFFFIKIIIKTNKIKIEKINNVK